MTTDLTPENRFDLIFDEKIDGPELEKVLKERASVIQEVLDEEFSEAEEEIHEDAEDV